MALVLDPRTGQFIESTQLPQSVLQQLDDRETINFGSGDSITTTIIRNDNAFNATRTGVTTTFGGGAITQPDPVDSTVVNDSIFNDAGSEAGRRTFFQSPPAASPVDNSISGFRENSFDDAGAVSGTTTNFGASQPVAPIGTPIPGESSLEDPTVGEPSDTAEGTTTNFEDQTFPTSGFNPNATAIQAQAASRRKLSNDGDWRWRLSLAANSTTAYRDQSDFTILAPLLATDGIIFPYTPKVSVSYAASYVPANPVHSNYTHYFYQNSSVGAIDMTATFTAQSIEEANYLLAVIHFLRSATRMYYGQDPERGTPPPILFLSGLGDYQFKEHPVVLSRFDYNLPDNVNYIRARPETPESGQLMGPDLSRRRSQVRGFVSPLARLLGAGLTQGAEEELGISNLNLGLNDPTYVPTKIDLTLGLLPMISRKQVTNEFSFREFANGKLLKKGFW